jgi:hypothetical protein
VTFSDVQNILQLFFRFFLDNLSRWEYIGIMQNKNVYAIQKIAESLGFAVERHIAQTGTNYLSCSLDKITVKIRIADHQDAYAIADYSCDNLEGSYKGAVAFLRETFRTCATDEECSALEGLRSQSKTAKSIWTQFVRQYPDNNLICDEHSMNGIQRAIWYKGSMDDCKRSPKRYQEMISNGFIKCQCHQCHAENMICPHCGKKIAGDLIARHFAAMGGSSTSERKSESSRRNGRKGGRPKKARV